MKHSLKDKCVFIGSVAKINKKTKNLIVFNKIDFPEDFPIKEPIFIEIDGCLVPFFMDSLDIFADKLSIKLKKEYINNKIDFIDKKVYMEKKYIDDNNNDSYIGVIGYELYNSDKERIGKIEDIIQNPSNPIFVLYNNEGKEILVPANENIIVQINDEERKILIDIPEGLLNIND